MYQNYRRVTSKTVTDGQGHSYVWSYAYSNPALNSLGRGVGAQGPNMALNSATVYYANYAYGGGSLGMLARPRYSEFRGHSEVVETDPNQNQTEHYFIQGDIPAGLSSYSGCWPTVTGYLIKNNPCFQALQQEEFLKGREWKTITHTGAVANAPLSTIIHRFATNIFEPVGTLTYPYDVTGLWHAFSYETQTVQLAQEGTGSAVSQTTNYYYTPSGHETDGQQHGNLTEVEALDASGAVYRRTFHDYTVLSTTTSFIVDRETANYTQDSAGHWLSLTHNLYDGSTTLGSLGSHGDLTLTRQYYDVNNPLRTSLNFATLHGSDTAYTYDSWGNQLTSTVYAGTTASAGAGSGSLNGATWTLSVAGGGTGTARTTTNTYDGTYHALLTQIDPPAVGGITLTQHGGYDMRMGTLTSITDPNNNVTSATYDVFGRLKNIIKPGDSTSVPTTKLTYYDTEQPFRYVIQRLGDAAAPIQYRTEQQFYDGLGRLIQSKSESGHGTQNIVVDKRYDGLGSVTAELQPHYVAETSTSYWAYTAPGQTLVNATTTTYDGLGRALAVTPPDNHATAMSYGLVGTTLRVTSTIDGNGHKTDQRSDVFGRLAQVLEYTGADAQHYSLLATTTYAYNPLDLLTDVTDQLGNHTTVSYDALGRKSSMHDPDMGSWSYHYDTLGNLLDQTDAKSQTISFTYDALGRLTEKDDPGNDTTTYAYDGGTNGKGQRTGAGRTVSGGTTTTSWTYDSRERTTLASYTLPGLGTRNFSWTYDSGDRVTSMGYPGQQLVNYTYDTAWRPQTMRGQQYVNGTWQSLGYYVSNAHYTALGQPLDRTLGNGLTESWQYNSPMQRLSVHQVGSLLNRSYTYDNGGNVATITDNHLNPTQTQNFTYDARDRLLHAWTTGNTANAYDESASYDVLGNFMTKGTTGSQTGHTYNSSHPHAPISGIGGSYGYDANGNRTSGRGDSNISWNADNQLTGLTHSGTAESYTYDGDGNRVKRVAGSTTTYYVGTALEKAVTSGVETNHFLYSFGGTVVAERATTSSTNVLTYLHADHLGSVSLVTSTGGGQLYVQEFTPWGSVRTGGVPASTTTLNYTGQRLDGTGLLYYNARYYDPALGRFIC